MVCMASIIIMHYYVYYVCVHNDLYVRMSYVVVTGRKRTLLHSKWANSISYISRMLY